jgi:hypothetical protein
VFFHPTPKLDLCLINHQVHDGILHGSPGEKYIWRRFQTAESLTSTTDGAY